MKIYTRTGDKGQTSLSDGSRVSKNNPRVATYGSIDELNSILGICVAHCADSEITNWIEHTQKDLFVLGSWLASPLACANIVAGKEAFSGKNANRTSLTDSRILELEQDIDRWEQSLTPLTYFILPGGSITGSHIHLARSVCRKAERECIALLENGDVVPEIVIRYLNRLADALFVLARYVNALDKKMETPWQ